MREPPADFVARLKGTFGSDWDVRWNHDVGRWEFLSTSVGGMRVSQFWGWFHDATTGQPLPPDTVTGLHAFRDLDASAQDEIIRNMHRSYIGQTGYGVQDWQAHMQARRDYNTALRKQRTRDRAQKFADLIAEFDIRRPGWRKDHQPRKRRP